jgi:hypothetical protein
MHAQLYELRLQRKQVKQTQHCSAAAKLIMLPVPSGRASSSRSCGIKTSCSYAAAVTAATVQGHPLIIQMQL